MNRSRKLDLLIQLGWLAALTAAALFCLRVLVPRLLPLLAGVGLAVAIHPAAQWLGHRLRLPPRAALLTAALLFLAAAGAVLWGLGLVVWVQWGRLAEQLPRLWQQDLLPFLLGIGRHLSLLGEKLLPGSGALFSDFFSQSSSSLQEWVGEISARAMTAVGGGLKKLPSLLLTLLFTLAATLLTLWDYRKVTEFLARQLPAPGLRLLHRVKGILGSSVLKLAKAYSLLFCITVGLLSLGLWLLGVGEFFVVALAIAIVDLLPVVGSGIVLVSWSAVVFAGGRTAFGVGLLALWGLVSLTHFLLEPKIVGDQIGLHPLVTLTAMYFGLRTAGVAGMLGLPLACLVAVRLQADGKMRLYK